MHLQGTARWGQSGWRRWGQPNARAAAKCRTYKPWWRCEATLPPRCLCWGNTKETCKVLTGEIDRRRSRNRTLNSPFGVNYLLCAVDLTIKGEVTKQSWQHVHDEHGEDGQVGDVLHLLPGATVETDTRTLAFSEYFSLFKGLIQTCPKISWLKISYLWPTSTV